MKNSRKITRTSLSLAIFCALITNPVLINSIQNQEIGYAWLFFINYIIGLFVIWQYTNKRIGLLLLFYLTSGLFIGGRFFAKLIGCEASIWEPTFFFNYYVSIERQREIMCFVLVYFNALALGSIFYKIHPKKFKKERIPDFVKKKINRFLRIVFIPLAIIIVYRKIQSLITAMSMGYISLYLAGAQGESSIWDISNTIMLILLGLSMAYGDKKNKKDYLALFIIASLITMAIGGRGAFGAILLVLLWIYSQTHPLSLKKIGIIVLGLAAILISVASLSIRFADAEDAVSALDTFQIFLHSNGITLMVFDASRIIDNYPWQPYFQNLLPGFVRIVDLITGQVSGPNATFASSLAYNLNPNLYLNGSGLGWTLMSDIYLYSRGSIIIFGILIALFSYCCRMISDNMRNNGLVKTIAYCIATSLFLLPRDGLNSVIPLIYYSIFVWLILRTLYTPANPKIR